MKNSVKSLLRSRNSGLLAGLLIMLALAAGITPKLFVPSTIISMLRNNCIYVFLAVAEFIVIISGAIDLSGPAILSFTACFSAVQQMNHPDTPVIVWVLISLVIGVACGAVNGLLVYKLKMNPMIATLGSQYVIRGFAFMVSNGVTIFPHQVSESFQSLATGKFLGFQAILWYAVVVMILAAIFLGRTMLGRHVYAIGSNMESARIAGLNTGKISITAYMISGFLAAFAGVMYIANFANVSYQVANGYEMTAIAISILGGASVTGGKGQVSGLVLSVMMIAVINSFLSMLPGMNLWSDAIQGLIILVAVVLNKSLAQREHLQELKEQEALL